MEKAWIRQLVLSHVRQPLRVGRNRNEVERSATEWRFLPTRVALILLPASGGAGIQYVSFSRPGGGWIEKILNSKKPTPWGRLQIALSTLLNCIGYLGRMDLEVIAIRLPPTNDVSFLRSRLAATALF